MLRFLDSIPYPVLIVGAILMLLAPFEPMPHVAEKLIMLNREHWPGRLISSTFSFTWRHRSSWFSRLSGVGGRGAETVGVNKELRQQLKRLEAEYRLFRDLPLSSHFDLAKL